MPAHDDPLPSRRLVEGLGRLYSLMLWLFPRRFRRDYGAEMRQVFESRLAAEVSCGGRAGAMAWREAADLPGAIVRAHGHAVWFGWKRFSEAWRGSFDISSPSLFRVPAWGISAAMVVAVAVVVSVFPYRFRPLPYPASERLVSSSRALPLWSKAQRGFGYSFAEWQEFQTCYENMAAFTVREFRDPQASDPAPRLRVLLISPEFFDVIGVGPGEGTLEHFGNAEGAGYPAAVVSDAYWRKRLGGDSSAIGREIRVDGRLMTVAAVMPPRFWFFDPNIDVWAPISEWAENRPYVRTVARLTEGNTVANAEVDAHLLWYELPMGLERVRVSVYSRLWYALAAMIAAWAVAIILARMRQPYRLPGRTAVSGHHSPSFAFLAAELLLACAAASALWVAGQEIVSPTWPWRAFPNMLVLIWMNGAAVWWSLAEQKTRCLACLRSLRMPVSTGRIGSVLLDCPATEYICMRGHGTLRVPKCAAGGTEYTLWKPHGTIWDELVSPSNSRQSHLSDSRV